MKTIIIDNFLPEDLNDFLKHYLRYNTNFSLQSSCIENKEKIFLMGILNFCPLMQYIFLKIKKTLNLNLELIRCYSNVQYPNMDGDFHADDGKVTCLLMVKGEGPFEIKNEKKINFKENRLIIFDAQKLHKGHAPKKGYRITLAFKTKICEINI